MFWLTFVFNPQTQALNNELQAARGELSASESRLAALGRELGTKSATQLQPALAARLAELSETSQILRETAKQLAASQQDAREATVAVARADRRGGELQKALGAAEEGGRKLEGELITERQASADARADAQEAHAEAAQRKQVCHHLTSMTKMMINLIQQFSNSFAGLPFETC